MHFNEVVNLGVLPAGKDGGNLVDVGSLYFIKISSHVFLPLKKEGVTQPGSIVGGALLPS